MDILPQVKLTIDKYKMISPGDTVLVGVSGGPDSVALLHLLARIRDDLGLRLFAAHLNHMFRGEEAEADARLVEGLAREWRIDLVAERVNVPEYLKRHSLSPQQGAREVRYRFFEDTAARIGAARVALGHHADDQAETVLLNLIRGAGTTGLSGIPPVRGGVYIRPLLGVRRKQVESYCRGQGIPYRLDQSNLKAVYLRNRVRLELIPLLEEKYNPAVVNSLNRLASIAREDDDYLDCIARDALERSVKSRDAGKITIFTDRMNSYPDAIRRRLIRAAYRELAGYGRAPALEHIDRALEMAAGDLQHGTVELPGGIDLVKSSRLLEIIINSGNELKIPFYQYPLSVPGLTVIPETGRGILAETLEMSDIGDLRKLVPEEAVLDLESLKGPLCVRRRKAGDVFSPFGMSGKMKLKKYFIDRKVPEEERDAIPIVTCGNDIVWVAGFRPGDPWKVTGETRACLRLVLLEDP